MTIFKGVNNIIMDNERKNCSSLTQAGQPCQNKALENSEYCKIHQPASEISAKATESAPTKTENEQWDELIDELNALAVELKERIPTYTPPTYSPQKMRQLLTENIDKLIPESQKELITDLRNNFEGTTLQDFADIDTWKGMWYVVSYMVESESQPFRERMIERVKSLPGMGLLSNFLR